MTRPFIAAAAAAVACVALVSAGCGEAQIDSVLQSASGEKSGADALSSRVQTMTVEFNPDGAPVLEFEAPGVHCSSCAASLEGSLRDVPGVVDVKASSTDKVVKVAVDESKFDRDAAVAAIGDSGFGPEEADEVETVEGAAEPAAEAETAT